MNNVTHEQHVVMNAQLILARKILKEYYNADIDSRNVYTKGGKLICEISQQKIPSDGIMYLNSELYSKILCHPDDKIRDNSVLVEFV